MAGDSFSDCVGYSRGEMVVSSGLASTPQGSLCKKVILEVTVAGRRPQARPSGVGRVPVSTGHVSAGLAPVVSRTNGKGFSVVEGILFSLKAS